MATKRRLKHANGSKTPVETTAPVTPEVALVPQEHGGALRNGGTNSGGPGRPTDRWRAACRQALEDSKGLDVVKEIISGDIHELVGHDRDGVPIYAETRNKDRLGAIEFLTNYAHGKPPQEIRMTGDAPSNESGEAVMHRLLAMIGRALLAAPAAQRLAVIHEIERGEAGLS